MKSPLRYQMTEYDSGSTAILNGISYLIDREKINPVLVSSIYRYSLDTNNTSEENIDGAYNSKAIFSFINKYINDFNKNIGYKLHCEEVESSKLDMSFIKDCISNNSTLIIPMWENGNERYVTLTNVDDNAFYIFDPYYMDKEEKVFNENRDIIWEDSKPMEYNRVIPKERMFGHEIPFSIHSPSMSYIITSNDQAEGVHIAKKFDYIFEKSRF